MASTKLVCIKQKSPTLPTKYPAWHAGLRQIMGFFAYQLMCVGVYSGINRFQLWQCLGQYRIRYQSPNR